MPPDCHAVLWLRQIRAIRATATEQLDAWKRVTDAVHAKGGKIVVQLWHGAGQPFDHHENIEANLKTHCGQIDGPIANCRSATRVARRSVIHPVDLLEDILHRITAGPTLA